MDEGSRGQVVSLSLNVGHKMPMRMVDDAAFIADEGIEGDRHATPRTERRGYQVLLIEHETLEAFHLNPGDVRENVTTTGVNLSALASGQRLALGDGVVLEISKPCAPCSRMEEVRPGLQGELEGGRGMLAAVVEGGRVKTGDPVRVMKREEQHVQR